MKIIVDTKYAEFIWDSDLAVSRWRRCYKWITHMLAAVEQKIERVGNCFIAKWLDDTMVGTATALTVLLTVFLIAWCIVDN